MNNDELDRILSKQDSIQPSSGFTAYVMDAVREEAAAPPPIPFPWKRALPVLVVAVLALATVLIAGIETAVQLARGPVSPQVESSLSLRLATQSSGLAGTEVVWILAALLAALVSVKLSLRLASGRA
jgi:hypothetical protein